MPITTHRDLVAEIERLQARVAQLELRLSEAREARQVAEAARRELEGQLRQSQKVQVVGQLAGGVAHDFNNLLTVMNGRCELLLHHLEAGHRFRPHVELLRDTAQRASALTRQLLAFTRQQAPELAILHLGQVAAEMESMLQRLIGEQIELVIAPDPGSARVRGDRGQIEQVILNLVVNARDAMPQGGRLTIETGDAQLDEAYVRTHPGARAGAYVQLSVRDTGVGMDAATRARIFEPFFTTKAPGQGTGLGLTIVYAIVKQHGGYIDVESTPGQGTRFVVYWPRCPEGVAAAASSPEASPAAPRGTETVLLVEDELTVRELVREILETLGYAVLPSRHGGEALVRADQHAGSIDALLTDVVMPELGGRELAARLRALHPGLRVLFMSGYVTELAMRPGAPPEPLLTKPFTSDALAWKLREVLDAPAGPRDLR